LSINAFDFELEQFPERFAIFPGARKNNFPFPPGFGTAAGKKFHLPKSPKVKIAGCEVSRMRKDAARKFPGRVLRERFR